MEQRETDVVVLGCGAAGAAIGCLLSRFNRLAVTVVYRGAEEGSSFSNQKWKHSGALYPSRELAREAWDAYGAIDRYDERRYILGPQSAHLLSDDPAVLDDLRSHWRQWDVASWGLGVEPITLTSSARIGAFGRTCLLGGFLTPDCVLDFPSMIQDVRLKMASSGVIVEGGSQCAKGNTGWRTRHGRAS
jgi:glycine/D-amino acid oxidase-like deaminating enzyme